LNKTPQNRAVNYLGSLNRPPGRTRTGRSCRGSREDDIRSECNLLYRTVAWLRLTRPDDSPELSRRDRVLLRWEIFAVFAVSLGASGVSAFVSLIGSLTAHHSLASQSVTLNGSAAPGRPLLDLFLQLVGLAGQPAQGLNGQNFRVFGGHGRAIVKGALRDNP